MISHHHRAVFVHVPKTGGQSIEQVFLSLVGLDWETRAPLLLRPNDNPRLGPPRLAHLRAVDYVRCHYLPQDLFEAYFVFGFVRNPWDRVISLHRYLGFATTLSLTDFVMGPLRQGVLAGHWFLAPQFDFLSDAGRLVVDFVGRFEHLQADFERVCERLDLPPQPLPWVNASRLARGGEGPAMPLWTPEALDLVGRLYASDVEQFGYGPPLVGAG